jgi:hypothetical protein
MLNMLYGWSVIRAWGIGLLGSKIFNTTFQTKGGKA